MTRLLLAASLATFGVAAHAQATNITTMQQSFDMLRTSLSQELSSYGVTADVSTLDLSQIVEIINAISAGADNRQDITVAIERAIER
jgi:hypothetical protein